MTTTAKPLDDIVTGEEASCVQCGETIYAVIDPYSGVVDWGSAIRDSGKPEDFGCSRSPLNDDQGTGGHEPGIGHTPLGFRTRGDLRAHHAGMERTYTHIHDMGGGLSVRVEDSCNVVLYQSYIAHDREPTILDVGHIDEMCDALKAAQVLARVQHEQSFASQNKDNA